MITGFTKTLPGTLFSGADLTAIFANIKTYLAAATISESTATLFRFGPADSVPGTDADDTPFTSMELITNQLRVQAYVGVTGGDIGSQATFYNAFEPALMANKNRLHFACNPQEGWWWMAADDTATTGSGRVLVGTPFGRVAADMTQGVHARFGLLVVDSSGIVAKLPYVTSSTGVVTLGSVDNMSTPVASPYGSASATRMPGATLPRGIAPLYPAPQVAGGAPPMTAAVFGDARCAMMATDGFTWGEEAAPGWRVFGRTDTSADACHYMALRSPAVFDVMA